MSIYYPEGMNVNDPRLGPSHRDESTHYCPDCDRNVLGWIDTTRGISIFWHDTGNTRLHEQDITDEFGRDYGDGI